MSEQRIDTRRALLGGAAAGSLLVLLGRGAGTARAQLGGDRAILVAALDVEQRLLEVYEGAAEGASVDVDTRGLLRLFAAQQEEHVVGLNAVLGGRPPARGDRRIAFGGRRAVLQAAVRLEEESLRTYRSAHERLADSSLITLGAGIMANHGQRLVALRDALGASVEELVPSAFATGT